VEHKRKKNLKSIAGGRGRVTVTDKLGYLGGGGLVGVPGGTLVTSEGEGVDERDRSRNFLLVLDSNENLDRFGPGASDPGKKPSKKKKTPGAG